MLTEKELMRKSKEGDAVAFHALFSPLENTLKSYLYRLTADQYLTKDLYHDTFLRAFDRLGTFEERSSFKTWVFRIASNLTIDYLRKQNRWAIDNPDHSKALAVASPSIAAALQNANRDLPHGVFVIREHIDFCFTCMGKTLEIEQQIAVILKDIYQFAIREMAQILNCSTHNVKRLLSLGRKTLRDIYDHRCALVNKAGMCHQCSELNNWFNGKQHTQADKIKRQLEQERMTGDRAHLYDLRLQLIRFLDPLNNEGHQLHEIFMDITKVAIGEQSGSKFFQPNQ